MKKGGGGASERRDLKGKPLSMTWVCTHCQDENCNQCIDVSRAVFEMPMICACKRPNHRGEPVNNQIKDPETGAVHAPGMVIHENGEVERT